MRDANICATNRCMTSHRRAYMVQWAYENLQQHISQPTTRAEPINAMIIEVHSAYT